MDQQLAADVRQHSPLMIQMRQAANPQPALSQAMLVDAFKQAIRELPVTEQHWNDRGYQEYQRKEGQRVRELNEYFSYPRKKGR